MTRRLTSGGASPERALAGMAAGASEPSSTAHPCPPSSGDAVSLLEIMEDTRLVLGAFLRQSLTVAPSQRPGRVGGAYRDANKFSARRTEGRRWTEDGWDSLDEQISVAEGKKHGFKDMIKKRLRRRSRPAASQHPKKEASKAECGGVITEPKDVQLDLSKLKFSVGSNNNGLALKKDKQESDAASISSTSSAEGGEKKEKKKKKKLRSLSSLLRRVKSSRKESATEEPQQPQQPKSPDWLPLGEEAGPQSAAVSPSDAVVQSDTSPSTVNESMSPTVGDMETLTHTYPPQFYDEVAGTLDRIAQKCTAARPVRATVDSQPGAVTADDNKGAVVRQLVEILSMQGDAINRKIQSDPFLRSTLARLSYPSFAKLLDTFASEDNAPSPVAENPTLSRVAVTMEVSRRVITATGMQRMRGYAEQYMQNFTPWVQSQGGWDKVVQLEDFSEYD